MEQPGELAPGNVSAWEQSMHRIWADPLRLLAAVIAGAAGLLVVVAGTMDTGTSLDARAAAALFATAMPVLAVLLVARPWPGLLGWLVAMPLLNVVRANLDIGNVQVISSTVLAPSLLLGWLLDRRLGRRSPLEAPVIAVVAIICIAAMAATIRAGVTGLGLSIAVEGLVVPAVVGGVALGLIVSGRRLMELALAMGISLVLATGYNIFRLVRGSASLGAAETDRVDFARFTYYNVGIFGDMLAMTLPLLIGIAVVAWKRGNRILFRVAAVAIAIEVAGAYLSFTKSAWLGCLLGAAVTLVIVATTWRRRAGVLVATALIALLIVPYPLVILQIAAPELAARYTSFIASFQGSDRAASWNPTTQEGEVSITERLTASKAGLEMARDHPLLGVGPGQFAPEYAGPYHDPAATRVLESPHNLFVDLAAEFGLPLMAIVTALIVAALAIALAVAAGATRLVTGGTAERPRAAPGDPVRTIAAGLAGSLIAFIAVAMTFGLDLYRPWRYLDSDVVFAALLIAASIALGVMVRRGTFGDLTAPGFLERDEAR